ncbi:MAG: sigma-70 family RNA polymerase sigma factor [Chitinophagaceae bacterium]|nr:sigma-70 family RNA polymerase sigma factor [Chitinophagaceae bacterium]
MSKKERPDNWLASFPHLLEEVYREYYKVIVIQAKDITKDLVKAEEIAARKFRTIYDMCGKGKLFFDTKESVMWYWLKSARKEAGRKRSGFKLVPIKAADMEEHPAEDERILAIIGSHMDFKREVRELLQELPQPDLQIVTLYVFENLSHKEIAAKLGLSHAVTRKRYERALAKLEARLNQLPGKKARLKDYLPVLLAILTAMPDQQ